MLRHEVGVHLDVGELVRVALEVDLEVALGGEAVAADVALVGPLARVAPHMDLQGRVGAEDLAAVPVVGEVDL